MTDKAPVSQTSVATPVATRRKKRTLAIIAIVIGAMFLLVLKVVNEKQRIAIEGPERPTLSVSEMQKFASETEKQLLADYGGESTNATQRALVERIGAAIVSKSGVKSATQYRFHLLAEKDAINMYALPDGAVFVTTALVNRMQTEGQLAAALSEGIAHTMARDVLGTPAPNPQNPGVKQLLRYTSKEELAADSRALTLMNQAGYDPNALLGMFTILTNAYGEGADVEFFVTHPNTQTRMQLIVDQITKLYPQGVPAVLSK